MYFDLIISKGCLDITNKACLEERKSEYNSQG